MYIYICPARLKSMGDKEANLVNSHNGPIAMTVHDSKVLSFTALELALNGIHFSL